MIQVLDQPRPAEPKAYTAWGNNALIFEARDRQEVLVEGPAGTGKTRAMCEFLKHICTTYPGVRILVLRFTLKSLRESVQVCLEDEALGNGHPAITGTARRENRQRYRWPWARRVVDGKTYEGESEIVLGGLDTPSRTYSTQYDIIWVEEAFEVPKLAWAKLVRANRRYHLPWQQMIATTNPEAEDHWLNRAADEGQLFRIVTRHWDNPTYYDWERREWTPRGEEYIRRLSRLPGVLRDRLFLGKWITAKGLVFDAWDPSLHHIAGSLVCEEGYWWVHLPESTPYLRKRTRLKWFFFSADWGYRPSPGCLQAWGVDGNGRMFLVREAYHLGKQADWWAEIAEGWVKDFGTAGQVVAIVCDSAEPDRIDLFNDRLGYPREREAGALAIKANKSFHAGVDQVIAALTGDGRGEPRLYVLRDALVHAPDSELADQGLPTSTAKEIGGYRWPTLDDDDKPPRRDESWRPEPGPDHGCDALRYACMWAWLRDHSTEEPAKPYQPSQIGYLLGKNERRPAARDDYEDLIA